MKINSSFESLSSLSWEELAPQPVYELPMPCLPQNSIPLLPLPDCSLAASVVHSNPNKKKKSDDGWSDEQLSVILEAVRGAKGGSVKNQRSILQRVNAVLSAMSGRNHTLEECSKKIAEVKFDLSIREEINKFGNLDETAITDQLNKTIEDSELEILKDLYSKRVSVQTIAKFLLRSCENCKRTIKKHHLKRSSGPMSNTLSWKYYPLEKAEHNQCATDPAKRQMTTLPAERETKRVKAVSIDEHQWPS